MNTNKLRGGDCRTGSIKTHGPMDGALIGRPSEKKRQLWLNARPILADGSHLQSRGSARPHLFSHWPHFRGAPLHCSLIYRFVCRALEQSFRGEWRLTRKENESHRSDVVAHYFRSLARSCARLFLHQLPSGRPVDGRGDHQMFNQSINDSHLLSSERNAALFTRGVSLFLDALTLPAATFALARVSFIRARGSMTRRLGAISLPFQCGFALSARDF